MRNFLKNYKPEGKILSKDSPNLLSKVLIFGREVAAKVKNFISFRVQRSTRYKWFILAIVLVVLAGAVFLVKTKSEQQASNGQG